MNKIEGYDINLTKTDLKTEFLKTLNDYVGSILSIKTKIEIESELEILFKRFQLEDLKYRIEIENSGQSIRIVPLRGIDEYVLNTLFTE